MCTQLETQCPISQYEACLLMSSICAVGIQGLQNERVDVCALTPWERQDDVLIRWGCARVSAHLASWDGLEKSFKKSMILALTGIFEKL